MFTAIRNLLVKPEQPLPRRGRGLRLAQLFAFEFVVVLLGVLTAQLLQDWYAERRDARRARAAVVWLEQDTRRLVTTAEYRLRAHECEAGRLDRLTDIIRTGGAATEAERATPIMPMPVITEWAEETRQLVARHVDARTVSRYDALRLLAQMIAERQRMLEDQWADFRLLADDVRDGESRASLRLAAARNAGLLSAIDMNARYVRQSAPDTQPDDEALARLAALNHPCAAAALRPVITDEVR